MRYVGIFMLSLAVGTITANAQTVTDKTYAFQEIHDGQDNSRSQLASFDANLKLDPLSKKLVEQTTKAVAREFVFPKDAADNVYGIDVSHHNGTVDWASINLKNNIKFVYIKATQGNRFIDGKFKENWSDSAANKGVHRGAYHFLSANVSGAEQADAFIAALKSVGAILPSGKIAPGTLKPVVDVEWDCSAVCETVADDKWGSLSKAERLKIISDWVSEFKEVTHEAPIIYTSKNWWISNIGGGDKISGVSMWIVDYPSAKSSRQEPIRISNHPNALWQFTDVSVIGESNKKFDASRVEASSFEQIIVR